MSRITNKDLEGLVQKINECLGMPLEAYTKKDSGISANLGNFHLHRAYGGNSLCRISSEGGGVTTIFGFSTKRELYYLMKAYLAGLEFNKK